MSSRASISRPRTPRVASISRSDSRRGAKLLLVDPATQIEADVCLVLEGTYPYVAGGVSAWVHELVGSLPDVRFALLHIGSEPGAYTKLHYQLPRNVVRLAEHYCHDKFGKSGE